MIQARLVVVGGEVKTSEIKLRLPCTIGRGRGSSIVLAHPLVSRQHCEIFESEGRLMVRDLGSLNGTFINNQRIGDATALPANELLTVGTVTFRAVYDPAESDAAEGLPPKVEDTVYAGRGQSTGAAGNGSGTVPLPAAMERQSAGEAPEKSRPASASDSSAFPPAAQLPEADRGEPTSSQPATQPEEATEPNPGQDVGEEPEQAPLAESDDDFQDFLKSLEKDEK